MHRKELLISFLQNRIASDMKAVEFWDEAIAGRRHRRWLDGGVHPLGTPERRRDDESRHERRSRRERRLSILRRAVADALL